MVSHSVVISLGHGEQVGGGGLFGESGAGHPFFFVFQAVVASVVTSGRGSYWLDGLFDEVFRPAWGELESILGHGRAELVFHDVLADTFRQGHREWRCVEPVGEHGGVVGMAGLGGHGAIFSKCAWDRERDAGVDGVGGAVDVAEGDVDAHLGLIGGVCAALEGSGGAVVVRCAELDPVSACHLLVELALVVGVVGEFLGGHACAVFLREGVGFELACVGIKHQSHLGFRLGFLVAPLEEGHDLLPDGIGNLGPCPSHRRRGFGDRDFGRHMADKAIAEIAEFVEGLAVGYEFHLW